MRISICMCTYNGEKFIEEQLQSLVNQTKKPNEIIIFDDCSTDNTINKINEFKKKYLEINWIVKVNENNQGWKVNFKETINKATGDYIFLCDQDDIWDENKLKNMTNLMTENSQIELLACNFIIKNENNIVSEKIKQDNAIKIKKVNKNKYLTYTGYPGCSYCFKKSLIKIFNSVWDKDFPHDAILWKIAFLRETLYVTNYKGLIWRRHENCATNKIKDTISVENVNIHYNVIYLYDRYFNALKYINGITNKNNNKIDKIMKMIKLRKKLYEQKSIISYIQLFTYIDFYASFKSYAFDIMALSKKNTI